MKYRDHRGGYAESMATVVELADHAALVEHIRKQLVPYAFAIEPCQLTIQPHGSIDKRNGWNTHIVFLAGYGVLGFTDGMPP